MVVEGVDILEETFDELPRDHFQASHQGTELALIYHAIVVSVHSPELLGETAQELFVLPQLEVQDCLKEQIELELVLAGGLLNGELLDLVPCQLLSEARGSHLRGPCRLDLGSCLKHGEGVRL